MRLWLRLYRFSQRCESGRLDGSLASGAPGSGQWRSNLLYRLVLAVVGGGPDRFWSGRSGVFALMRRLMFSQKNIVVAGGAAISRPEE